MIVQQGRLGSTDTTKNMADYYDDSVASSVKDVDRSLHNATQFVRLVLQNPEITKIYGAASGSPDTQVEVESWKDQLYVPVGPISPADMIVVEFGRLVPTLQIIIFSTQAIDTTTSKWHIGTSLNNLDSEFISANFLGTISTVGEAVINTPQGNQFRYLIDFTAPAIDTTGNGMPFWRILHDDSAALAFVTSVELTSKVIVNSEDELQPFVPSITYFDTDGSNASSFTFEKSRILDACYDNVNGKFYTIRFNPDNVGSTETVLGDDFSEAAAGSAAATNNFNPARWIESTANPQFLRNQSSEILTHNVSIGDGQLETTYTLEGDCEVQITVDPQSLPTNSTWFAIRALDANNNTIMSEGVGTDTSVTTTGVWFSSSVASLDDQSGNADLKEARPLWHNTQIGTDTFTVAFSGTVWQVSGTLTGALTDAQTGVFYDESVDAGTPLEFLIASTATPTTGEKFTFDLVTASGHKFPETTGAIGFTRSSTTWSGLQGTINPSSPQTVVTDAINVELYGYASGPIDLEADDFVVSGTESFPEIAVLTVEATDNEGDVTGSPLIESFDVIGDPSLTYNNFLDGRVQIATTSSGSSGGFVYIKVNSTLYKYSNSSALATESGTNSVVFPTTDQIPQDGTSSFNWTHTSSIGGSAFLTYLEYESGLDILHTKTLNKDTLLDTTDTKEVLLDISDYSTNAYTTFFDQNDFDTLYYIDSGTNMRAFNLDDRISAFMAVNATDTTLPAGTAQTTTVNADVINAWGEALDGKTVTFQVTAGDGAVTPSTDVTISGGRATTQFTVGATVGVSTITATVTET